MVIMDVPKSEIFVSRPEDRELYSLNRLLHRSLILVVDWDPNECFIVVFPQPSYLMSDEWKGDLTKAIYFSIVQN